MTPAGPVLRWHGGKWLLAPWIISHFPPHRIYVEPYGGAASVLLRKEPAYAEVWNDRDDELVNLFSVLRSSEAGDLSRLLRATPFSRTEFNRAYEDTEDPVERARRLIIRSFMGFGSGLGVQKKSTGFRSDSNKSGSTPAQDWSRYPDRLEAVVQRFSSVVIENRPALELIEKHDRCDALFYVDPPYLHSVRSRPREHRYAFEMTDADHIALLDCLLSVKGMVVLSGYSSEIYDDALSGWHRTERHAFADGARDRTEVLWLNPSARDQMPVSTERASQIELLEGV